MPINYSDRLKSRLKELDRLLTGKSWQDVYHTSDTGSRHFGDYAEDCSVPKWLMSGEEYYLSDGGYSRVIWFGDWCDMYRGHLALTSNSRKEVQQEWERHTVTINEIESAIRSILVEIKMEQMKEKRKAANA